MQNRPFKTPIWGLLIHFGVTVLFICAPPAGDAFDFVVNLTTYPGVFLLTLVGFGLVKLRLDKREKWNEEGGFRVPWVVLGFYLAGNLVSSRGFGFIVVLVWFGLVWSGLVLVRSGEEGANVPGSLF